MSGAFSTCWSSWRACIDCPSVGCPGPNAIVVSSPSLFPILPAERWARAQQGPTRLRGSRRLAAHAPGAGRAVSTPSAHRADGLVRDPGLPRRRRGRLGSSRSALPPRVPRDGAHQAQHHPERREPRRTSRAVERSPPAGPRPRQSGMPSTSDSSGRWGRRMRSRHSSGRPTSSQATTSGSSSSATVPRRRTFAPWLPIWPT